MAMNVDLAIAMPTYFSELDVKRAIDSIPKDEKFAVIIVDDNSSDRTTEVAKAHLASLSIPNIVKCNPNRLGATDNIRNTMVLASSIAKFTLFLSPDDRLVMDGLSHFIQRYEKNPNLLMTNNIQVYTDAIGVPTGKIVIPPSPKVLGKFALPLQLVHNLFAAPGSTFRSSAIKPEFFGINTNTVQDWCLGANLLLQGKIETNTNGYVLYKRHGNSVSSTASYEIAHVEWHEYLPELLEYELRWHVRSWTVRKKINLYKLVKFFMADMPNCIHKIKTLEYLARLCGVIEKSKVREISSQCSDSKKLERLREENIKAGLLFKFLIFLLNRKSSILNSIIIICSTISFLFRRIVRSVLSLLSSYQ